MAHLTADDAFTATTVAYPVRRRDGIPPIPATSLIAAFDPLRTLGAALFQVICLTMPIWTN